MQEWCNNLPSALRFANKANCGSKQNSIIKCSKNARQVAQGMRHVASGKQAGQDKRWPRLINEIIFKSSALLIKSPHCVSLVRIILCPPYFSLSHSLSLFLCLSLCFCWGCPSQMEHSKVNALQIPAKQTILGRSRSRSRTYAGCRCQWTR